MPRMQRRRNDRHKQKVWTRDFRMSAMSHTYSPLDADAHRPRFFDASTTPHFDATAHEQTRKASAASIRSKGQWLLILSAAQFVTAAWLALRSIGALFGGTADEKELLLVLLLVASSAAMGLHGALTHARAALTGFFLTQVWALAQIVALWLGRSKRSARRTVFCQTHASAEGDCEFEALEVGGLLLGLLCMYVSLLASGSLSEALQDRREYDDNASLVRFTWLMNQKLLVGVRRFEDALNRNFEDLFKLSSSRKAD